MIDAHFHRSAFATFLEGEGLAMRFAGLHPWQVTEDLSVADAAGSLETLERSLAADAALGVGEIGLDRLRTVSEACFARARHLFAEQLERAARFRRPVVLHGAKCWGEVVKAALPYKARIPAFLFHGFSRSAGLVRDIIALNGFISVGPALLNDHAVNYRALVAELPPDRLLVETDLPDGEAATPRLDVLSAVYAKLAELRGLSVAELARQVSANVRGFTAGCACGEGA